MRSPLWVKSGLLQCKTSCPLGKADMRPARGFPASYELSGTREDNPDLSEFTWLRIDFDRTCVLLDDDVVANREAKTCTFSRRLGCEERLEHLFLHIRRNTCTVIADSNFHTITKTLGRGREGGLMTTSLRLCFALRRRVKAI